MHWLWHYLVELRFVLQFQLHIKYALRPLPVSAYRYTEVTKATVYVDYHVELDGHYYAVPHRLVGAKVETHASAMNGIVWYSQNICCWRKSR